MLLTSTKISQAYPLITRLVVGESNHHCSSIAISSFRRTVGCRIGRPSTVQMSTLSPLSMSQDEVNVNTVSNGMTQENQSSKIYPIEMTDDERYLFDLNGYLIVRNVLSPEEVQAANVAIDHHIQDAIQRDEGALRNAVKGSAMYGTGPGRQDLGRVLQWGKQDSAVFKSILAHPRLVPLFHGIIGKGYRMDHLPFVIMQNQGAEGFQLHGGTIDCSSGDYNPHLAYACYQSSIRCALLGCNVILTNHDAGDGGFCIVPGSHKSNFKMPNGMVDGNAYSEYIQQPTTKAGDVILFSEGTVHGAMPWTSSTKQRRVCLYRFAPATNAYGRSYFGADNNNNNEGTSTAGTRGGGWPIEIYDDLNEAQLSVLEPPYANRLDRPNIRPDGTVEITSRNARKMKHDHDIFGTKYF
jgi:ectoine hydroxylase-related dioxygenase (phytanoyl-CoA dioxygenase family)